MKYLLSCLCFFAFITSANAAVNFIMDEAGPERKSIGFDTSSERDCINDGYDKTLCNEHSYLHNRCPYNAKYYRTCCPKSYMYTQEECVAQGLHPTAYSCAGLYGCF